jgi:hypothetical protein
MLRAAGVDASATAIAVANDSEAPESWLSWDSLNMKLLCGFDAHRRWHYSRAAQPFLPIRWYIRSVGAPYPETLANLWRRFVATITCSELPWVAEAREAQAEEAAAAARVDKDAPPSQPGTSSSVRSARELGTYKRRVVVVGIVGGAICWAVFTWCVLRAAAACCVLRAARCWQQVSSASAARSDAAMPHVSQRCGRAARVSRSVLRAGSFSSTECSSTACWATGCVQRRAAQPK